MTTIILCAIIAALSIALAVTLDRCRTLRNRLGICKISLNGARSLIRTIETFRPQSEQEERTIKRLYAHANDLQEQIKATPSETP